MSLTTTDSQIPAFAHIWDEHTDHSAIETAFRQILNNDSNPPLSSDLRAEALTQLARAQGLQDHFEDAKATLKEALATSQELIPHIRYHLEMGRVLRSSKAPAEESAPYFRKAYDQANNAADAAAAAAGVDFFAADAAHMLAILYPHSGPSDTTTWAQRTLEIARGSENVHTQSWAAIALNNSAWDLFDEKKYEESLEMFREATTIRKRALENKETAKTKSTYRIARWSEAFVLRHLDRFEDAYTIQKQLLSEGETKPNRQELVLLCEKLDLAEETKEHRSALETKF
ncbi:hypothetical protein EMPS_03591 [Entomortierella parvispora]|uniref:Uncharacterized protein n=1 Tax=Entomortierella parvispora TaxID=205924 RepID=A0A9P3H6Y5_9FUNG|nr:hypothetical protein EMPS_03591 [Entomortierella parvispora]